MHSPLEVLEQQIDELRAAVRRAVGTGDRELSAQLRRQLRAAEAAWNAAVAELEQRDEPPHEEQRAQPGRGEAPLHPRRAQAARANDSRGSHRLLPIREQVHQALTLLGVPAAPRLIVAVHDAFSSGALVPGRLTSIRRDEERSFRAAPYARAYYLCAALTADLLGPARGLLAISTWKLDVRVIGPLSPRVDFLTAAIRVAGGVQRMPSPTQAAVRLLWRFAANIPGAPASTRRTEPAAVIEAARTELAVHADQDRAHRSAAAARASTQLDDAEQLFGSRIGLRQAGTSA